MRISLEILEGTWSGLSPYEVINFYRDKGFSESKVKETIAEMLFSGELILTEDRKLRLPE